MSKPSCAPGEHTWGPFQDDIHKNRRICTTCGDWGYVRRKPGGNRRGGPPPKVIPMRCGFRRKGVTCQKNGRHLAFGSFKAVCYCDDHKYLADEARKKEETSCQL